MAANLAQSPITRSHVVASLSTGNELLRSQRPSSTTQQWNKKLRRFLLASKNSLNNLGFRSKSSINKAGAAEQSSALDIGDGEEEIQDQSADKAILEQLKAHLYDLLQGINRGIFGVTSAKKIEIEEVVKQLESKNPTPEPTRHLEKVAGTWKLVYSTITILGSKRTKLGLRDFIELGDFFQVINVAKEKAVNVIKFSARGFRLLAGQLQIDASFKIASKSRVDISYNSSTITPEQLMSLFQKNYDLLLSIFNPAGWLEITYVDDSLRIGRDDKGNMFILERSQEEP